MQVPLLGLDSIIHFFNLLLYCRKNHQPEIRSLISRTNQTIPHPKIPMLPRIQIGVSHSISNISFKFTTSIVWSRQYRFSSAKLLIHILLDQTLLMLLFVLRMYRISHNASFHPYNKSMLFQKEFQASVQVMLLLVLILKHKANQV